MSRAISVHYIETNELASRQLGYVESVFLGLRPDHKNGGVIIKGCGMEMGFAMIEGWARYCPEQVQFVSQRWLLANELFKLAFSRACLVYYEDEANDLEMGL